MRDKELKRIAYSAVAFHDALRQSPGLSDAAIRVALILTGYADATGTCWPSQARVARDLEWSLLKAKRAFRELQAAGVIRYKKRARHRGERSSIQLITGITVDTGMRGDTGIKTDTEPVSKTARTGITGDTQNSPSNSPKNSPIGADSAAPAGEGESSGEEKTTQGIVAFAVSVAAEAGITLTPSRKARIGRAVKELFAAGANPANLEKAAKILTLEAKPPSALEGILNDIEGATRGRMVGSRRRGSTDPRAGRSENGEW